MHLSRFQTLGKPTAALNCNALRVFKFCVQVYSWMRVTAGSTHDLTTLCITTLPHAAILDAHKVENCDWVCDKKKRNNNNRGHEIHES
jgi:hypothetical protein